MEGRKSHHLTVDKVVIDFFIARFGGCSYVNFLHFVHQFMMKKKNVKNIGKRSNYPGLKYSEALTYSVFVIPVKFVFKFV